MDDQFAHVGEMSLSGYLARKEVFFTNFREKPDEHPKLLDIGCGAGEYTSTLAAAGFSTIGVDLSDKAISFAQQNFPSNSFKVADVEKLPFEDSYFDIALALGIFEYMSDEEINRSLFQIRRILKPSGVFYSMMLSRASISYRLGVNLSVSGKEEGNRFLPSEEKQRFSKAGFTNIEIIPVVIVPPALLNIRWLIEKFSKFPLLGPLVPHVFMLRATKI